MNKQVRSIGIALAVLALAVAIGLLAHLVRVQADPPDQWNEPPLAPPESPQTEGPNPNERDTAPGVGDQAGGAAPPGTSYLVLPAAAFSSDGVDPDGFFFSFGGGYLVGTAESGACLAAPVRLPAGTTVVSLEVFLLDSNNSNQEWFDLYRVELATGSTATLATVSSPIGTTGSVVKLVDDTVAHPEVSDAYAYYVATCARPSIYVHGVRIGHFSGAYLPSVMRDN
ncbi:MAG: hypothetical protein JXA09_05115 [Anaerolineae bacterium]|nr:hypothetical protein [Anaerolineae bacterium]